MKIYLDFEANIDGEIIAIGAVTEHGDTFSRLVRPHKKLDRKVSELTGITMNYLSKAQDIDSVGLDFFRHWLPPILNCEFYTYGDGDEHYLKYTAGLCADKKIAACLLAIASRLKNISSRVEAKFGRQVGLQSAYLTMTSQQVKNQRHNALEDAQMLRYVEMNIDSYVLTGEIVKVPKKDLRYGKGSTKWKIRIYSPSTNKEWIVSTLDEAANFIGSKKSDKKKRLEKVKEFMRTGKGYNGKYFESLEEDNHA